MTGDLRQAWRARRRAPGVAAVAALSIGLANAANASAFSIVSSMLLRPLPVREPDRAARRRPTPRSPCDRTSAVTAWAAGFRGPNPRHRAHRRCQT